MTISDAPDGKAISDEGRALPLFRSEALDHYLRRAEGGVVAAERLRWTTVAIGAVAVMVVAGLLGAVLFRADVARVRRGRIVHSGGAASPSIVALVPRRDRVCLRSGMLAVASIDCCGYGPPRSVPAAIVMLAPQPATDADAARLLGRKWNGEPLYRVDLEPQADLRDVPENTRVDVRFEIARPRVIALAMTPLRRWLD